MKTTKNEPENLKAAPTYKNEVTLVGHLGDAPQHFADGFTTFSLATKTFWKAKEATYWNERTEWHRCVAWGKLAEALKPLAKGDRIQVEGELRSHEYNREIALADAGVAVIPVKRWEIRAFAVRKLPLTKAQTKTITKKGGAA